MSKEIEEGCRAVIVNASISKNANAVVTVGKFIGEVEDWNKHNHWVVDIPIFNDKDSSTCFHIDESYLKRIDDYDGEEKSTWQELSHIWVPDELTEVV